MTMRKALVVGGLGVTGSHIAAELAREPGWTVVASGRHAPDRPMDGVEFVIADLADAQVCASRLGELRGVTHVFYCARNDNGTPAQQVERNVAMLRHVVDAVEPASADLRHIQLMHGMKAYGNMLGPFKTPAEECDPRILVPSTYDAQEDFIRARQAGRQWNWSALRPGAVCGRTFGYSGNLVTILGVYGSLCRELGLPLWYPGTAAGYAAVRQVCDAHLLARAAVWVATQDACANPIFNVHNGDCFRWQHLWPRIADFFGVPPGGVQGVRLRDVMPQHSAAWQRMAERHGLVTGDFDRMVSWDYADVFHNGWDAFANATRLHLTGFREVVNTGDCLIAHLQRLREQRVIP